MYELVKNERFRLTWDIVYYALKCNILGYNKIWDYYIDVTEIEDDENNLICEMIVLHEDDLNQFLDFLEKKIDFSKGKEFWQFIYLYKVYKNKELLLKDKLMRISVIWADYGYSEELKGFIYYMPSDLSNSSEGIYDLFEQYILDKKTQFLSS